LGENCKNATASSFCGRDLDQSIALHKLSNISSLYQQQDILCFACLLAWHMHSLFISPSVHIMM
jgi:hypothetical protein